LETEYVLIRNHLPWGKFDLSIALVLISVRKFLTLIFVAIATSDFCVGAAFPSSLP
jgi:hypothetical protein